MPSCRRRFSSSPPSPAPAAAPAPEAESSAVAGRDRHQLGFHLGLPPFVEHAAGIRKLFGTDADIGSADDEIVGSAILNIGELVDREPGILVMPAVHEFADGGLHESRQIPDDVGRVFAGQLHVTAEARNYRRQNTRAGHKARREGFVMAVAQPQDPAVIWIGLTALDLNAAAESRTLELRPYMASYKNC